MQLQTIQQKIYEIRSQQVMLDFDLAELYETETKRLKEAVKRNIQRFPSDFMFELTKEEYDRLRTQFASLNDPGRGKHSKYLPFAFTEQGVAMLASVLSSPKAIEINIGIVRAFVFMRQYALSHRDLSQKLEEIESRYDRQFSDVYEAITYLLQKDEQENEQRGTTENRVQGRRLNTRSIPGRSCNSPWDLRRTERIPLINTFFLIPFPQDSIK